MTRVAETLDKDQQTFLIKSP